MSGPKKIRDSQKMVHFLRTELQNSILSTPSAQQSKDPKILENSPHRLAFSVKNSTHFTSYYLKSKEGEYERSLLDVEDLNKVYQVVRDNLQVPRPEIPVENDDVIREFEEKVKNDVEYREKVLKEQRQARILRETRRRKTNASVQNSKRESQDPTNTSFTSRGVNEQADTGALKEIDEKNLKNVDVVKTSKKVGKYDVEVDRQVGHKISYHVYAILEKPPKPKKKEVKAIDQKEPVYKLLKDDSVVEVIKTLKSEEESPFVKVLVKEHDAFKRENHYVPLKNEEINIEERMKKKWNARELTTFSGSKVRRSFHAPSLAFNELIGECDVKLKFTKANNSTKSDNNKQFLETFNNLSEVAEYRNSALDREYGISLKHSSLVAPSVKLPTLEEKVEERNTLFGKSEEGGKTRPKNIKVELEKYFDNYQRLSSRTWRNRGSSYRPSMASRSFQRASHMRSYREDDEEGTERRREQKGFDPHSTHRTNDTHSELVNKRKGSTNDQLGSMTDKKDTSFAQAFLTQSNFGDKEQLDKEDHKSARPEPSEMYQTHRTQSSNPRESVYNPRESQYIPKEALYNPRESMYNSQKNNEDGRGKMEISTSYDLGDPTTIQKGFWTMKGPRATRINSILVDGILERENDGALDFPNTSKSSSRYRPNRSNTRQSDLSASLSRKTGGTPCDQIEDRLNKSFNDFMNVKVKADNKFKMVVNILEKDRPLFNKIRHNKYDATKMIRNNIEKLREDAENFRVGRYKESKEQRALYLSLLDFIVNQEHHPTKLKACYYFMNVWKELLERGDKLSQEKLNQLLNKIDDKNSITKVFIGTLEKVVDLIKVKAEEIENTFIKEHLEKHLEELNRKRRYQK